MKGIITVNGKDKTGILYGVTKILAENNVNVEDISQTIRQGYFTMMMIVDLSALAIGFNELKAELENFGQVIGLQVRIQREEIFNEMHMV
ncbi:MAG: ACT domain-containing protein [Desulfitobacteriia bacterium]|jgi:ACT domain-containing protein